MIFIVQNKRIWFCARRTVGYNFGLSGNWYFYFSCSDTIFCDSKSKLDFSLIRRLCFQDHHKYFPYQHSLLPIVLLILCLSPRSKHIVYVPITSKFCFVDFDYSVLFSTGSVWMDSKIEWPIFTIRTWLLCSHAKTALLSGKNN